MKIGDNAQDFTLPDADENIISLNDLLGKKMILWFFPRASTPGWMMEGNGFRSEFKKFQEKNIHIIGCSADSPKKQKKFCEKQGFQYPLLCDESHDMLKSYGVWGKKKFMGKEYMGITRLTYVIDEKGIIEKVYEKVKPLSHANDILKDLS